MFVGDKIVSNIHKGMQYCLLLISPGKIHQRAFLVNLLAFYTQCLTATPSHLWRSRLKPPNIVFR